MLFLFSDVLSAQHPCLTLTKQGVENVKQGLGSAPLFDNEYAKVQKEINEQIITE